MERFIGALFVVAFVAAFSLLSAVPFLIAWNLLIPTIFGIAKINIFQAWGLLFLIGICFKKLKK